MKGRSISIIMAILSLSLFYAQPSFAITRSEVISRAQKWVGKVTYGQTEWPEGYRTDCSGYVSYCWKTTDTNGNPKSYFVNTFSEIVKAINKEELKPGDALTNGKPFPHGHIALFESWVNEDHTKYWGYELCKGEGCKDQTNYWRIDYPYWLSSPGCEDYSPVRYLNIVDSETFRVPDDYETIQEAINSAGDGDTVLVANGIYTGEGNKDIDFMGKTITVRSENGADVTIIDCEGSGRGFFFGNGEGTNSILDGFTITNGFCDDHGGGIYCCGSSPTITNCAIIGNRATGCGGGIKCCDFSSPAITNCTIVENRATYGGGIECYLSSSPTIINCTISRNSAVYGGGIECCENSSPTIVNSILWFNGAPNGAEIALYPSENPLILTISYSDIAGGESDAYVGSGCTLDWGDGNIDANPLFVNPWDENYHLSLGSPCIDVANGSVAPETDKDGNSRYDDPDMPDGPVAGSPSADMGAYEYCRQGFPEWARDIQIGDILYDRDSTWSGPPTLSLGDIGHVGIYVGCAQTIEADKEKGVAYKNITTWDYPSRTNVYLLRVNCADPIKINAVEFAEGQERLGKPYNRFWVVKCSDPDNPHWYCSELVWAAYYNYGIDLNGRPGAVLPSDIYNSDYTVVINSHVEEEQLTEGIAIMATCPVDLEVADPDGLIISYDKQLNEIPGATYIVYDFSEDDVLDRLIIIPERKTGKYLITVSSEPDALPTDTYTLNVSTEDGVTTLAENVPISEIPTGPYTFPPETSGDNGTGGNGGDSGDEETGEEENGENDGDEGDAEVEKGSNGDGCFIATACFDTPTAREVHVLKELRDRYLVKTVVGRAFVKFYYKTSPPIANFIRKHPVLKTGVRIALKPFVWFCAIII